MNNIPGFWSLLLGANTYSTQRAKWFYEKAESIYNLIVQLLLLIGVIYLLVFFVMSPSIGVFQLIYGVLVIFFFLVFVIFNKLVFMAVGALIRIGEILENNAKSIFSTSNSSYTPLTSVFSNPARQTSDAEQRYKNEKSNVASTSAQSVQSSTDPARDKFDSLRIEATKKISAQGHTISMHGDYPFNKWEIKYKNGKTKRISNIEDLILASMEFEG
jgi:hypothetical protein